MCEEKKICEYLLVGKEFLLLLKGKIYRYTGWAKNWTVPVKSCLSVC